MLKNSIHNSLDDFNPSALCILKCSTRDGVATCSKFFSCTAQETVRSRIANYVIFRRRDVLPGGGKVVQRCSFLRTYTGKIMDYSWVFFYSAVPSKHIQCYIIVELRTSKIEEFMCLLRYDFKDTDKATVKLYKSGILNDKVSSFRDARYILPSEAVWCLLKNCYRKAHANAMLL